MPEEFLNATSMPENRTVISTEFSKNETISLHTEMTTEKTPEEITTDIMNEILEGTLQHNMCQIYNATT